jgi:hypothetical protein
MTEIRLQYFDGCPCVPLMHDRVRAALIEEGMDVEPVLEKVASSHEAERLRLAGSPTILIDGRDPLAEAGAPFGFWCRLYVTPTGLEWSPTVEQLRSALRSA